MEAVGLVTGTRVSEERGRPAQVYATAAPRMRLARAGRKQENRAPLARAAAAAAQRVARDYAEGFERKHWAIAGSRRNHWFFRVVAAPSPERLRRINALLDELAEVVWTPDAEPGPAISIAWFLAPIATHTRGDHDESRTRRRLPRRRRSGQRARTRR